MHSGLVTQSLVKALPFTLKKQTEVLEHRVFGIMQFLAESAARKDFTFFEQANQLLGDSLQELSTMYMGSALMTRNFSQRVYHFMQAVTANPEAELFPLTLIPHPPLIAALTANDEVFSISSSPKHIGIVTPPDQMGYVEQTFHYAKMRVSHNSDFLAQVEHYAESRGVPAGQALRDIELAELRRETASQQLDSTYAKRNLVLPRRTSRVRSIDQLVEYTNGREKRPLFMSQFTPLDSLTLDQGEKPQIDYLAGLSNKASKHEKPHKLGPHSNGSLLSTPKKPTLYDEYKN